MKDRERRKKVLSNGTYQDYTAKRKQAFMNGIPNQMYSTSVNADTGEITQGELSSEFFGIENNDLKECENIRHCKNEQRKKVEEHIKYLFEKSHMALFFVTLNFNDEALKLKPDTRRQKVRRLLNKICDDYILNIDYGEKKGREHYHAIIALKEGTFTEYKNDFNHIKIRELDCYDYGNYDLEKIKTGDNDKKRLARYITKLTLHSVKVEQKYISVKKGSDYQTQKNLIKSIKKDARNDRFFKPDYNDLLMANSL